jgi:probable rRNA maturation factor
MIELEVQRASNATDLPSDQQLLQWVQAALAAAELTEPAELTIRIVDSEEGQALNRDYRQRDYATNVLSFPFDAEIELPVQLLGDLVICAPVVAREAIEQNKSVLAHWAHMVVHGSLHLLGYDHMDDDDAVTMESLEVAIMATLGFANPYPDELH